MSQNSMDWSQSKFKPRDAEFERLKQELLEKHARIQSEMKEESRALFHQYRSHPDGLIFSATARCKCGAGLAYEEFNYNVPEWRCSAAMADESLVGHDAYPFALYEMKSENQKVYEGGDYIYKTTRKESDHA